MIQSLNLQSFKQNSSFKNKVNIFPSKFAVSTVEFLLIEQAFKKVFEVPKIGDQCVGQLCIYVRLTGS